MSTLFSSHSPLTYNVSPSPSSTPSFPILLSLRSLPLTRPFPPQEFFCLPSWSLSELFFHFTNLPNDIFHSVSANHSGNQIPLGDKNQRIEEILRDHQIIIPPHTHFPSSPSPLLSFDFVVSVPVKCCPRIGCFHFLIKTSSHRACNHCSQHGAEISPSWIKMLHFSSDDPVILRIQQESSVHVPAPPPSLLRKHLLSLINFLSHKGELWKFEIPNDENSILLVFTSEKSAAEGKKYFNILANSVLIGQQIINLRLCNDASIKSIISESFDEESVEEILMKEKNSESNGHKRSSENGNNGNVYDENPHDNNHNIGNHHFPNIYVPQVRSPSISVSMASKSANSLSSPTSSSSSPSPSSSTLMIQSDSVATTINSKSTESNDKKDSQGTKEDEPSTSQSSNNNNNNNNNNKYSSFSSSSSSSQSSSSSPLSFSKIQRHLTSLHLYPGYCYSSHLQSLPPYMFHSLFHIKMKSHFWCLQEIRFSLSSNGEKIQQNILCKKIGKPNQQRGKVNNNNNNNNHSFSQNDNDDDEENENENDNEKGIQKEKSTKHKSKSKSKPKVPRSQKKSSILSSLSDGKNINFSNHNMHMANDNGIDREDEDVDADDDDNSESEHDGEKMEIIGHNEENHGQFLSHLNDPQHHSNNNMSMFMSMASDMDIPSLPLNSNSHDPQPRQPRHPSSSHKRHKLKVESHPHPYQQSSDHHAVANHSFNANANHLADHSNNNNNTNNIHHHGYFLQHPPQQHFDINGNVFHSSSSVYSNANHQQHDANISQQHYYHHNSRISPSHHQTHNSSMNVNGMSNDFHSTDSQDYPTNIHSHNNLSFTPHGNGNGNVYVASAIPLSSPSGRMSGNHHIANNVNNHSHLPPLPLSAPVSIVASAVIPHMASAVSNSQQYDNNNHHHNRHHHPHTLTGNAQMNSNFLSHIGPPVTNEISLDFHGLKNSKERRNSASPSRSRSPSPNPSHTSQSMSHRPSDHRSHSHSHSRSFSSHEIISSCDLLAPQDENLSFDIVDPDSNNEISTSTSSSGNAIISSVESGNSSSDVNYLEGKNNNNHQNGHRHHILTSSVLSNTSHHSDPSPSLPLPFSSVSPPFPFKEEENDISSAVASAEVSLRSIASNALFISDLSFQTLQRRGVAATLNVYQSGNNNANNNNDNNQSIPLTASITSPSLQINMSPSQGNLIGHSIGNGDGNHQNTNVSTPNQLNVSSVLTAPPTFPSPLLSTSLSSPSPSPSPPFSIPLPSSEKIPPSSFSIVSDNSSASSPLCVGRTPVILIYRDAAFANKEFEFQSRNSDRSDEGGNGYGRGNQRGGGGGGGDGGEDGGDGDRGGNGNGNGRGRKRGLSHDDDGKSSPSDHRQHHQPSHQMKNSNFPSEIHLKGGSNHPTDTVKVNSSKQREEDDEHNDDNDDGSVVNKSSPPPSKWFSLPPSPSPSSSATSLSSLIFSFFFYRFSFLFIVFFGIVSLCFFLLNAMGVAPFGFQLFYYTNDAAQWSKYSQLDQYIAANEISSLRFSSSIFDIWASNFNSMVPIEDEFDFDAYPTVHSIAFAQSYRQSSPDEVLGTQYISTTFSTDTLAEKCIEAAEVAQGMGDWVLFIQNDPDAFSYKSTGIYSTNPFPQGAQDVCQLLQNEVGQVYLSSVICAALSADFLYSPQQLCSNGTISIDATDWQLPQCEFVLSQLQNYNLTYAAFFSSPTGILPSPLHPVAYAVDFYNQASIIMPSCARLLSMSVKADQMEFTDIQISYPILFILLVGGVGWLIIMWIITVGIMMGGVEGKKKYEQLIPAVIGKFFLREEETKRMERERESQGGGDDHPNSLHHAIVNDRIENHHPMYQNNQHNNNNRNHLRHHFDPNHIEMA